MGLRGWGVALLVVGLLVIGTGIFAAVSARGMWVEADARCAGSPDDLCGAGDTLAASFLFLLGPVGTILGLLLMVAGAALFAIGRVLDRAVAEGKRFLAAFVGP